MSNDCRSENAFVGILMVLLERSMVCEWKEKLFLFLVIMVLNLKSWTKQCPRNLHDVYIIVCDLFLNVLTCALYRQCQVRKCQGNFGLLSQACKENYCPQTPEALTGILNRVVCLEEQTPCVRLLSAGGE